MFAEVVYERGHEYIQDFQDVKAAIIVFIPCFIGFILALVALRGFYVIPAMNTSFGYLTRAQLFPQAIAGLTTGGFYFFGVLLDIKFIINNSHVFGLISTTLLPLIYSLYFFIALNRLLAVTFPTYYNILFKPKICRAYVFLCYSIAIIHTPMFTWYHNCGYKFYHYGWVFSFIITDTCGTKFEVLLRTVQSVLSTSISIFDVGTLISLLFFANRILKTKSAEMRKREINFGQQVVLQGLAAIIFAIVYSLAYEYIPGTTPETWKIFWTSTFIASLVHIVSTGVIFVFNAEFSKWLRAKKKQRTMPASVLNVA